MKKLLVLVIIALAIAAFLYFPRGASVASTNAATLAVVNTAIEGSRSGAAFAPALDGEVFANGDVVKSNDNGRAVLTFFDGSSLAIDPGSQVRVVSLNRVAGEDRKSTRLNSSHGYISYAVFCLKKKKKKSAFCYISTSYTYNQVTHHRLRLYHTH